MLVHHTTGALGDSQLKGWLNLISIWMTTQWSMYSTKLSLGYSSGWLSILSTKWSKESIKPSSQLEVSWCDNAYFLEIVITIDACWWTKSFVIQGNWLDLVTINERSYGSNM